MILEDCIQLDQLDEIAHLRDEFQLPEDVIYLDGNSLGPLLREVGKRIEHTVSNEWGNDLITSWNNHDWINLPTTVGDKIARLIGASPGQVICTDSVSVNLFKVLAGALTLRPDRSIILSTRGNFPTDLYMAQGLSALKDGRCRLEVVEPSDLFSAISESVAVLMLTEVNFRTGQRWNMREVNRAAHGAGVLVLWDLSHSTGAIPVHLDDCATDFAVGCGYKYLNGGPGAPAFLYVAERHQETEQPLTGWMGHARPFDFSGDYEPDAGIRRFSTGTPGIIGLSALDAAMDLWQHISVEVVQRKSISLANVVKARLQNDPAFSGVSLAGPGPGPEGGSQLSLRHPKAYEIVQALIESGIIGDFRAPDIIRFGLCPLFLSHVDVFNTVKVLAEVLESRVYEEPRFMERRFVT
jgi:kynureninase